jgi:hypothetical protein
LDNADPEIEVEILKLTGDGIHIIISSRGKFSEYTILELLPLSLENAEKMFFRHYPRAKSEPIFLKELLELIDSHTLLIEIFAKVLKESLELNSPLFQIHAALPNKNNQRYLELALSFDFEH